MTRTYLALAAVLVLGLGSLDAEAQSRRMGGGRNVGKQRPAPTMQEAQKAPAAPATPAQQAAAPAKPATTAPGAAPAAAAKPSFMQRWGGLLAGLGIGALLASLFGEQLGPIIGMLLAILAVMAVVMLLVRLFGRRGPPRPAMAAAGPSPVAPESPAQFRGIGSALTPPAAGEDAAGVANRVAMERRIAPEALAEAEIEPFLRVAKTSFIRLQAANDARDLDDIRDYTTPELYAELAMQIHERGEAPQRTEVVSLDARLVEAVVEGDYAIATVRFTGLTRENNAANPEPFDELWHVRKSLRDRKATWLVAGIQQVE